MPISAAARGVTNAMCQVRQALGTRNVFSMGRQLSYVQPTVGSFTGPVVFDPATGHVHAQGPNPVYPLATFPHQRKLVGPQYENKCYFVWVTGQSIAQAGAVGGGGDAVEVGDDVSDGGSYTIVPSMPGKVLVPIGGTIPNPGGAGSNGANDIWPPGVYASVVDAREAINYLRNPGKETERETPGLNAVLQLGAALPDSSKVVLINGSAGSSSFDEVLGAKRSITGYSWSPANGGELTFSILATVDVQVGDTAFAVADINPAGANGVHTTTAVSSGFPTSYITVSCPVEPAPYVSGGSFFNRAKLLQSMYAATLAIQPQMEELGLECELLAMFELGHESNSPASFDSFKIGAPLVLRSELTLAGSVVNPSAPAPFLLPVQVNWPRNNWSDLEQKIGHASVWAWGWVKLIRDGTLTRTVVIPNYFAISGLGLPLGSPHFGSRGSMRFGPKFGSVLADLLEGTAIELPGMLSATRNANSASFTTQLTGVFERDTTEVSEPGNGGIQYWNADIDAEATRALTEVGVSTVVPSTNLPTTGVTLGGVPDPRRNVLTAGFKNALRTQEWCGRRIVGASWDGSKVTLTLQGAHDHGLPVGITFQIFHVFAAPNDGIIGITTAAGTTGNVIVYNTAVDPGAFAPHVNGAFVIRNGNYAVGNKYGNRTTLRLKDIRHYSYYDGAPQPDYMVQDMIEVSVLASTPGLADQEAEIRTPMVTNVVPRPKILLDVADNACFNSGNTQLLVNLGASGSTDNFYNGVDGSVGSGDMTPSGVYNSKKRDGHLIGGGQLAPVGGSSFGRNMHKEWDVGSPNNGVSFGVWCGRYKTSANPQFPWSTCATEGSTVGAGAALRFSNNQPQLNVRNAANGSVWTLTNSLVLSADLYYVIAWYYRNKGKSWLWCNGVMISSASTVFSSPATGTSQDLFRLCANTPLATSPRPFVSGHQFHEMFIHDEYPGFDLEFGDLEPYINSLKKRHLDNAY